MDIAKSRFFKAGNPSSDESESESEPEELAQKPLVKRPNYDFDSSSEDEDTRVVKSEKQKKIEMLEEIEKKIQAKIKINDFSSISDIFDELNRTYEKSKRVIDKDSPPDCYLRVCLILENLTNSYTKADTKKLNSSSSKGLSILKQKLKKNNKQYAEDIKEFEEVNPLS